MSISQAFLDPAALPLIRLAACAAGVVIFVHFAAMAARCEGRCVPLFDALLIPSVAASGVGLAYTAAFSSAPELMPALLMCTLALVAFVMRIWAAGIYISQHLASRHVD